MSRVRFYAKAATAAFVFVVSVLFFSKFYEPAATENKMTEFRVPVERMEVDNNKQDTDFSFNRPAAPSTSNEGIFNKVTDFLGITDSDKKENVKLAELIVHLDLKGAPPKVQYMLDLMPFLKRLGATGLLMEYEDMFPYSGNFSMLRCGYAYSKDELKQILKTAKQNGLTVIPLIQTFGHMEWVLKHESFRRIREVSRYPQVSCPTNEETFKIVCSLIDQVVQLHPGIEAIHIGADEAYYVGTECRRCNKTIENLGSKLKLMLKYVVKVASYVKEKHKIRVLTWNDMFQEADPSELKESGIDKLVEPVIWGYATDLQSNDYFPPGLFQRFGAAFPTVWAASAFKGANGASQSFIDIDHYAQNHLSWLRLLSSVKSDLKQVRGVILTGWSRFDHFAVLCELMPVGIPSLAVDLQLLISGGAVAESYANAKNLLKCSNEVFDNETLPEIRLLHKKMVGWTQRPYEPIFTPALGTLDCEYPGANISQMVERLRIVRNATEFFLKSSEARGWLSEYNLRQQYGSVFMAEMAFNRTKEINAFYTSLGKELRVAMEPYFYDDTIDEWLFENVQTYVNKLNTIAKPAFLLMHSVSFRNRPLQRSELDV